MCEHKSIRCSLIQTIEGYHREDICTVCKESNSCTHFDLSKHGNFYDQEFHATAVDDELVADFDSDFKYGY